MFLHTLVLTLLMGSPFADGLAPLLGFADLLEAPAQTRVQARVERDAVFAGEPLWVELVATDAVAGPLELRCPALGWEAVTSTTAEVAGRAAWQVEVPGDALPGGYELEIREAGARSGRVLALVEFTVLGDA
ncbi:MAG: hypothetical protein ABIJ09_05275 [Pseudomonadota bacterium]